MYSGPILETCEIPQNDHTLETVFKFKVQSIIPQETLCLDSQVGALITVVGRQYQPVECLPVG